MAIASKGESLTKAFRGAWVSSMVREERVGGVHASTLLATKGNTTHKRKARTHTHTRARHSVATHQKRFRGAAPDSETCRASTHSRQAPSCPNSPRRRRSHPFLKKFMPILTAHEEHGAAWHKAPRHSPRTESRTVPPAAATSSLGKMAKKPGNQQTGNEGGWGVRVVVQVLRTHTLGRTRPRGIPNGPELGDQYTPPAPSQRWSNPSSIESRRSVLVVTGKSPRFTCACSGHTAAAPPATAPPAASDPRARACARARAAHSTRSTSGRCGRSKRMRRSRRVGSRTAVRAWTNNWGVNRRGGRGGGGDDERRRALQQGIATGHCNEKARLPHSTPPPPFASTFGNKNFFHPPSVTLVL